MTYYGLGRLEEFDERSRAFPIRALVDVQRPPRSYTWACHVRLDQGPVGACVGFSWAQELAARPKVVDGINDQVALSLYRRAQQLDQWPGEDYEGSSVLAGAKTVMEMGKLREYRWGFDLRDALTTIGYFGPVVLGVNWHSDMFRPNAEGIIRPTGGVVGGHAILANGISTTKRLVRLHNSWGRDWGLGGIAYIGWDDLGHLLDDDGEACVPVGRTR